MLDVQLWIITNVERLVSQAIRLRLEVGKVKCPSGPRLAYSFVAFHISFSTQSHKSYVDLRQLATLYGRTGVASINSS